MRTRTPSPWTSLLPLGRLAQSSCKKLIGGFPIIFITWKIQYSKIIQDEWNTKSSIDQKVLMMPPLSPSPFTILVVHWRSSGCPLSPCLLRTWLIASVPKTSFSLARLWFHFQYKWYASSILVFLSLLRLYELTQIAWVDLYCLSWPRFFCVDSDFFSLSPCFYFFGYISWTC